jgi:hypothetical protein
VSQAFNESSIKQIQKMHGNQDAVPRVVWMPAWDEKQDEWNYECMLNCCYYIKHRSAFSKVWVEKNREMSARSDDVSDV